MRKKFEGCIYNEIPDDWDVVTKDNLLMNSEFLSILSASNPNEFRVVKHDKYCCCEYKMKMNIFTFCKIKFDVTMNVIALPVSICSPGYVGDLQSLIQDYKRRRGLFLVLNIEEYPSDTGSAVGETLGNCVFENRFNSFDDYLSLMKSGYRRRVNIARNKGKTLCWKAIENSSFTHEMHRLYLNVFERSKYPLECLTEDFFKLFPGEIHCLYEDESPVAFVLLREENHTLSFIFGGMDYEKRNHYDLYMNMLVFIIEECIKRKCHTADLGQTAEDSKLRVGAVLSRRYLSIFSGNRMINALLKHMVGAFSYQRERTSYSIWKMN